LTRLGLIFHNENRCSVPFFRPKVAKLAKTSNYPKASNSPKATWFKYSFSQDLVDIAKQFVFISLVIDIISCDMNTDKFVKEVTLFAGLTGSSVEYSINQTGIFLMSLIHCKIINVVINVVINFLTLIFLTYCFRITNDTNDTMMVS